MLEFILFYLICGSFYIFSMMFFKKEKFKDIIKDKYNFLGFLLSFIIGIILWPIGLFKIIMNNIL